MWDTSKDYRILVANHAREQCLNIIQTASFRGNWNKKLAIETAKNMNSDFQSLSYSYLEGDYLVNSPDVASIIEKGEKIVECLGGDGWNKTFISNAPKEDKEKTMENVAKVRFFIDSVLGLKDRLALGPINAIPESRSFWTGSATMQALSNIVICSALARPAALSPRR